jgi:hypothetical protein
MHRARLWKFVGVLFLCGAGATIALAASGRDRHDAVYPPHFPAVLKFDHDKHLKEGAECETCHDDARKSVVSSDLLVPNGTAKKRIKAHDACDSCHDIKEAAEGKKVDPQSNCWHCHTLPDFEKWKRKNKKTEDEAFPFRAVSDDEIQKAIWPTANLVFNHQVHTKRKVECTRCHQDGNSGSMEGVGLATRWHLPKMETCLGCHDGQQASAKCATCHITEKSGRVQLNLSSAILKPQQGDPFGLDHGPRYEFNHGKRAKMDRKACLDCHQEGQCMTCHDSLQKPLSAHPNDYITLHPVQVRQDSLQCDACHRYQSFCAACHERSGVGLNSDPAFRPRNAKVHPNYTEWVDAPGPNHHGIAASRDIKQCISCHREETCTACHATQGANPNSRGTNPHPANFASLCRGLADRNDRGCLKCHTNDDLVAKGCK